MPSLRGELLKMREEDEYRRVIHSKRVESRQRTCKLRGVFMTEAKQAVGKVNMGEVLRVAQKISTREVNGGRLASYKAHTSHSPSESDTFSIKSSSSSCKSETDSIKKPSTPTSAVKKPSSTTLHMNLDPYFGQVCDVDDILSGCNSRKGIVEGFFPENSSRDGLSDLRFSEMLDNSLQIRDGMDGLSSHASTGEQKGVLPLQYERPSMESSLLVDPCLFSASGCSVTSFLENCCPRRVCTLDEIEQSRSIRDLVDDSHISSPIKEQNSYEHRRKQSTNSEVQSSESTSQAKEDYAVHLSEANDSFRYYHCSFKPLERTLTESVCVKKNMLHSRALSCQLVQEGNTEDFAYHAFSDKEVRTQKACALRCSSADRGTYNGIRPAQDERTCNEIWVRKSAFNTPSKLEEKLQRFDGEGLVTPPPVNESRYTAASYESAPLSPQFLSEANSGDTYGGLYGKDYFDAPWLIIPKNQPPFTEPCKDFSGWRSKSIGARASLRSAVRNLEAAFGGARSASLPKTRSQGSQKESSEGLTIMGRAFASPVKNRYKHSESLSKQVTQRSLWPAEEAREELLKGAVPSRRELDSRGHGLESPSSNRCFIPPNLPPLNTQRRKSGAPNEIKGSVPFLPTSRSMHILTPTKDVSGRTGSSVSRKPISWPNEKKTSSASRMVLGYLQCFERDGSTCYALTLKGSEETLLAKACTSTNASNIEGRKWVYTFQSGKSRTKGVAAQVWKAWLKKEAKFMADFSGRMEVSSEFCFERSPTGSMMHFLESEFVLYDERNDKSARSQSSRFTSSISSRDESTPSETPMSARSACEFSQSAAFVKKQLPSVPQSPSGARVSSRWTTSGYQTKARGFLKNRGRTHCTDNSIDVRSESDFASSDVEQGGSLSVCYPELAAIVIKMPVQEDGVNNHSATVACASLLFSKGNQSKAVQHGHAEIRLRPNFLYLKKKHGHAEGTFVNGAIDGARLFPVKQGATKNQIYLPTSAYVTMILPKAFHSVPKVGPPGPTSLTSRWKCGKCDCGGWDEGCGVKIFSSQRCKMLAEDLDSGNTTQAISDKQAIHLYSQGRTQEVVLSLSPFQEGNYVLRFQSDLASLKAFAAAVAILHSRSSVSYTTGRHVSLVGRINQEC
ncbi:hypothetical protein KP509_39G056600 [Ceratopteris richardii]|uniref:CCT domain-containing protein n=1 Tax=Ceratopteris richardii TaxID=49495 RepID=A0A8T2Q1J5_CERRI|nr:hypothetical protein KP509_39G056600 [Ceratopteris richardii]